jgi:hypothetical protein
MSTDITGERLAQSDRTAAPARRDAPAGLRRSGVIAAVRIPLAVTIATFALAFLVPAWPWLSGRVTIPWDAKSQFYPQLQFLATSIARGEWPWWTPNVFAGWPQISDPQSLIFSPLHLILAAVSPAISLRAFDAVTFAYLFVGGLGIILYFHDRGWHPAGAIVAALAFAFGGAVNARLQHTGQVISTCLLPLTLWMLTRALERASWRDGLAAGLLGGLIAIGRDQVALLSLYVLCGYVIAYWVGGPGTLARMRASAKPLAACAVTGLLVSAVPVIMTSLLAARSNRPEVSFADAALGALHPVHLLQFAFADLYGAMNPNLDYWAPPSDAWEKAWGTYVYLAQNMPLIYFGALPFAAVVAFGLIRGVAWAREIRVLTIAAGLMLLFCLGSFTPVFHAIYELPFVSLYRRPADATFVLCALLAIIAGYLVHRWLTGTIPPAKRWQRATEIACAAGLVGAALAVAHFVVGIRAAVVPVATAVVFTAGAIGVLALARRTMMHAPVLALALLAAYMVVDLRWNNAPHESTGLPPSMFEALRQNTNDETVRILKAQLAATAGPDRRDRVELIGIAYHWQNISLAQDFDHLFGHNPLRLRTFYEATNVGDTVATPGQRHFSPLYPSYRSPMADLFGVRFIATGVPVEQIDSALKPGDLIPVARTKDAYIYENPRALPRVMMLTNWRLADFDELLRTGWPGDVDPRATVLLKRAPPGPTRVSGGEPGTARIVRYANTEVVVEVTGGTDGILLLNDVWHPWWKVTIDGAGADMLKANVLFRAVVVPRGQHTVRFSFHPFIGAMSELGGNITHKGDR